VGEKKGWFAVETEYGRSIYIGNGGALQTTPGILKWDGLTGSYD
jgi:hypothetical protein